MHPIASQKGTRIVSGSMAQDGIRVASAPCQDGSTIDDRIAGAYQTAAHGSPDGEHKERLKEWGLCRLPAFAKLGEAGNVRLAIVFQRQDTRQHQSGPTLEPVMHVLIGQPPERFQYSSEEQRLLAVGARTTTQSFGQGRWTATMRQLDCQAAYRQQCRTRTRIRVSICRGERRRNCR